MTTSSPTGTAFRARAAKSRFYFILIFWGVGVLVAIGFGMNYLFDNWLYTNPNTQEVTATVTRTAHECDRVACGYDSYGTYTFYGKTYSGIQLRNMTNVAVTGEVTILVNHHRPKLAMDPYVNPYMWYATVSFSAGAVGIALIVFAYLMWRRAVHKREDVRV